MEKGLERLLERSLGSRPSEWFFRLGFFKKKNFDFILQFLAYVLHTIEWKHHSLTRSTFYNDGFYFGGTVTETQGSRGLPRGDPSECSHLFVRVVDLHRRFWPFTPDVLVERFQQGALEQDQGRPHVTAALPQGVVAAALVAEAHATQLLHLRGGGGGEEP